MTAAFIIVVQRQGARVAEFPVSRAVIRVGADPNSDVVLEGPEHPPTALTINFSDPRRILCYSRASIVNSIAGQPAPLNQGVPLPVQAEVVFANGWTLHLESQKSDPRNVVETVGSAPTRLEVSDRVTAVQRQVEVRKEPPRELPASSTQVAPKRQNSVLSLICGMALLGLVLGGVVVWSQGASSGVLPAKSPGANSLLTYSTIANQLLAMTPDVLANDSDLNAIRTHLQLAQKYRNTAEIARKHLEGARDLLRQRLGNEVISAEPLPDILQPQFDQISEQQLYRAICEALKR